MPYVYYDELPEGLEAAEVVSQENYDALADELAGTITQRDEMIDRLEEARREARETKSRYAQMILDGSKNTQNESKPEVKPRATTIDSLFGRE